MILLPHLNKAFVRIPKNASNALHKALVGHTLVVDVVRGQEMNIPLQACLDEHGVDPDTKFYAVIRDPVERQLSLYLYRARHTGNPVSVSDFRNAIKDGMISDYPHQMMLQSDYIRCDKNVTLTLWRFDEIGVKFESEFGKKLDVVNQSSSYDTNKLIDHFYTDSLKDRVRDRWYSDVLLYESLSTK